MTLLQPLIIGEVLFDHFPSGQRVLGGAPFNVAWNLQGLGLAPLFVSAVGDDDQGREIRARMQAWGLDTSAMQLSDRWPTGKVQVALEAGQPTYEILDRQAYDDIRAVAFPVSPAGFSLLYTGSLAYRNEPSRSTIRGLLRESNLPRLVDINIRQPWFDRDWAGDLLAGAEWTKLNDDELAWLSETECNDRAQIGSAVKRLRNLYGGRRYLVTCGSVGAYAVDERGELLFAEAPSPEPFVDTVGAGDAFAAATIDGICHNRPLDETLEGAVRLASRTCTLQGATTEDRNHYAS